MTQADLTTQNPKNTLSIEEIENNSLSLFIDLSQQDGLLALCVTLTGLCLLWAVLEKTGLIVGWLPKRKSLAEAFQTQIKTALGSEHVDPGLELQPRIEKIARGSTRASFGVERAQHWLAILYDEIPFSHKAFNKALNYAMFYTLAFWLLPWFAGGSGKLGSAKLLMDEIPLQWRLVFLGLLIPSIPFLWRKLNYRSSSWWDIFAYTVSFTLAVAPGGAIAVAVVVAVVFTFAFVSGGAIAFAPGGAIAIAFAGVVTFVFPFPFSFTFAVAVAVAVAVAYAFTLYYSNIDGIITGRLRNSCPIRIRLAACSRLALVLLTYITLVSTIPLWLHIWFATHANWSSAEKPSFALLFFLGWMPVINAVFDFLSVGLTQTFLGLMQRKQWSLWWWLLDALSALALVFGLYFLVFGLIYGLKWLGWRLDSHAILDQFLTDPFSSAWLLLLALTNTLPTLLHWSLGLAGLVTDSLGPEAGFAQNWAKQVLDGKPLGKVDAENFADYLLFGHRWFSTALALCLLAWTVWAFEWLLPHSLRWLL